MLKELNLLAERADREAAAWRRWNRKLPHNRVRRGRLRDAAGRAIGYGPPTRAPEPPLPLPFCWVVELPSGKTDVFLTNQGVAAAYRQARRPCATQAELTPLAVAEDQIRRLYEEYCR